MDARKELRRLGCAFAVCFVVAACIFWQGTYADWNELGYKWLIYPLMALATIVLIWRFGTSILVTPVVVGFVFPAVVFGRVFVDEIKDPSGWHHTLFPFELAISLFLGMATTIPAAGIGWLLRKLTKRQPMS